MKDRISSPSNDQFRFCNMKNEQDKEHAYENVASISLREMAKAERKHREFYLTH